MNDQNTEGVKNNEIQELSQKLALQTEMALTLRQQNRNMTHQINDYLSGDIEDIIEEHHKLVCFQFI